MAKKLTDRQKKTLQKHSEHHSPKHMKLMERLMIKGAPFKQAHRKAMQKVGK